MQTTPLVADALWQCLCPRFRQPVQAARFFSRTRPSRTSLPSHHGRRWQSAQAAASAEPYEDAFSATGIDVPQAPANNGPPPFFSSDKKPLVRGFETRSSRRDRAEEGRNGWLERWRSQEAEIHIPEFARLSREEIYSYLERVSHDGQFKPVHAAIEYLIKEQGEQPNLDHYAALVLAECHATMGSAAAVSKMLREMLAEGLEPDSRICHNILRALAVHPDMLLRNNILDYMRQRWINLEPSGYQDIVAGALREKQFESALKHLELMTVEGVQVPTWLYDMATHTLLQHEEIDEALRIIKFRYDNGDHNISGLVWQQLLDVASAAYNHPATAFAWQKQVEPGFLNPSSGVCLNALITAAREGDTWLATDIIRVLGDRKSVIETEHYELLMATYLQADKMSAALSILPIMAEAGCPVTESTTRPLYDYLKRYPDLPEEGFRLLERLKTEQRSTKIPTPAVNVVIEAAIHHEAFEQALTYYKSLRDLCRPNKPNVHTFNHLLRGCNLFQQKPLAMFLASEMAAQNVTPDRLTYDRLILICTTAPASPTPVSNDTPPDSIESSIGPFVAPLSSSESAIDAQDENGAPPPNTSALNDAYAYYFEMRSHQPPLIPRWGTLRSLAQRSADLQDERIWDVLSDLERDMEVCATGWVVPGGRRWVSALRPMVKRMWDAAQDGEKAVDRPLAQKGAASQGRAKEWEGKDVLSVLDDGDDGVQEEVVRKRDHMPVDIAKRAAMYL